MALWAALSCSKGTSQCCCSVRNHQTILINSAGHDFDSARWLMRRGVREVYVRGLRSRADLHPVTKDLLLIEMVLTNDSG